MLKPLNVEVLEVGPYFTNCYSVHRDGEGIIIDPGDDFGRIKTCIEDAGVTVTRIVLTHGHLDHIGAVGELRKFTEAPVLIHRADAVMLTDAAANLSAFQDKPIVMGAPDEVVGEGDIIRIAERELRILHTPGHTPGGISLVGDGIAFTGDALFWGSVGRTDLPGGDYSLLMHSIRNKLLTLPDSTVVYPGHGPQTTIGEERAVNPFILDTA